MRDDYGKVHQLRFDLSLQWIKPHLKPGMDVLELGGMSPFSAMVESTGAACGIYPNDLRHPFSLADDFWDMVLCMEVLEHIADTDGLHTEWHGDGAANMLRETFRVMKPGGILFLTTPNAASITAIHHALQLGPPMIYRPHVREYAPYELDELVRAAGFQIERRETLDVWLNAITPRRHEDIRGFLLNAGFPSQLRGEDIFLLAKKPILKS